MLAFGVLASALAACGPKEGTVNPPANATPLSITGMSVGGQGTVVAGAQAHILTVSFAEDLAGTVENPSITFQALNGTSSTLLTAPCALSSTKTLTCSYTVRPEDICLLYTSPSPRD